jgi:hypothetical protein
VPWRHGLRRAFEELPWAIGKHQLTKVYMLFLAHDEIQYARGHKYLTLVYQIEQGCTRLLWIGKDHIYSLMIANGAPPADAAKEAGDTKRRRQELAGCCEASGLTYP